MRYKDEDLLQLSGIQHFVFCRRQWALIHIEQQWAENLRTVEGDLMHKNAHDWERREKRGNVIITRGMPVFSRALGISGQCDVVEFRLADGGITLKGEDGTWLPMPVEYKRGKPKEHLADEMQLCAQAMCIEEMLCCSIPSGALYYNEAKRRTAVVFTAELRGQVRDAIFEMHSLYEKQHTPKVKPKKGCSACSLKDLCLPKLMRKKSVKSYMKEAMEDDI
ncbi:MAG: CRISPR-associated protein Cas4 [Clostridia bacterium]|nr:CRISPR-associated protein Cas4 [Clostridia bacterium]